MIHHLAVIQPLPHLYLLIEITLTALVYLLTCVFIIDQLAYLLVG